MNGELRALAHTEDPLISQMARYLDHLATSTGHILRLSDRIDRWTRAQIRFMESGGRSPLSKKEDIAVNLKHGELALLNCT